MKKCIIALILLQGILAHNTLYSASTDASLTDESQASGLKSPGGSHFTVSMPHGQSSLPGQELDLNEHTNGSYSFTVGKLRISYQEHKHESNKTLIVTVYSTGKHHPLEAGYNTTGFNLNVQYPEFSADEHNFYLTFDIT